MTYSDYRRIARENLAGNWGKSLGVAFVAAIFGALLAGSNIGFNIDLDAEYIQKLPKNCPFRFECCGRFFRHIESGAVHSGRYRPAGLYPDSAETVPSPGI